MAGFTSGNNKDKLTDKINDLNTGIAILSGFSVINPFSWIGVADINNQKADINNYLDNIDILDQYNQQLSQIEGDKISAENSAAYYEGLIEDLKKQKVESEEYLRLRA